MSRDSGLTAPTKALLDTRSSRSGCLTVTLCVLQGLGFRQDHGNRKSAGAGRIDNRGSQAGNRRIGLTDLHREPLQKSLTRIVREHLRANFGTPGRRWFGITRKKCFALLIR